MGSNSSNVYVDGASLKNDLTTGGVSGQDNSRGNPFPRSAIQEFRVIAQNFKAEYQKAAGAIITATTRSGTNVWTGNVLVGFQNKGLLALDTFQVADKNTNPLTFKRPDYSRVLAAVSAGGPIVHDRLFFFGSYEGNYQNRAGRVAFAPPTGFAALDTVNLTQYNGNFTSPFREQLLFGKLTYPIDAHSSAELSFNTRHETDIKGFGTETSEQSASNFRQDVTIGQLRYTGFGAPGSMRRRSITPGSAGIHPPIRMDSLPVSITMEVRIRGSALTSAHKTSFKSGLVCATT